MCYTIDNEKLCSINPNINLKIKKHGSSSLQRIDYDP
jgi:hypothetical protein